MVLQVLLWTEAVNAVQNLGLWSSQNATPGVGFEQRDLWSRPAVSMVGCGDDFWCWHRSCNVFITCLMDRSGLPKWYPLAMFSLFGMNPCRDWRARWLMVSFLPALHVLLFIRTGDDLCRHWLNLWETGNSLLVIPQVLELPALSEFAVALLDNQT